MSARKLRGHCKIVTPTGWREGHLRAGETVKLDEGEWLHSLIAFMPVRLDQDGLPMYIVTSVPQQVIFPFGQIARTFQVRRP